MKLELYKNFFKRFIDFILALFGLVVLFPFLIFLVPLISISNKGPFLFRQSRPGRHGKIFKINKFKTMNDKRDSKGKLLSDNERITRIGSFLRLLSLDEIPQLFNVLIGEMSLIGPRPLLTGYLDLYNARQKKRHDVRPGVTGWAQVNGRNSLSWGEKLEMDVWYVENISFPLDLKILILTIFKVFKREGINSSKGITMERFTGNHD